MPHRMMPIAAGILARPVGRQRMARSCWIRNNSQTATILGTCRMGRVERGGRDKLKRCTAEGAARGRASISDHAVGQTPTHPRSMVGEKAADILKAAGVVRRISPPDHRATARGHTTLLSRISEGTMSGPPRLKSDSRFAG